MRVTPWEVEGEIQYKKLVQQFGTNMISDDLIAKLESLSKTKLPTILKRRVFFSHRDLDLALKDYKEGKGFFVYTGRGPSGKMHLGHIFSFLMAKWLQDAFGVNVYIEITDDEKFLQKKQYMLEKTMSQSLEDIKDIASLGFDPDKTFIFRDTEYIGKVYPLMLKASKKVTFSTAKAVFGFNQETNIGLIFWPIYQVIPTFFEKKRALIPCAIDQDPYWRIQRDIAEGLGYYKASVIHGMFLPPLQGMGGKMSSSKEESAIYLSDDPKTVKKKINKYAFSGGQPTVEDHRKKGGNPDIDVSFNYLKMFLEDDDEKLAEIYQNYKEGKLLTGELKKYTIDKINAFLKKHQEKRASIDPVVEKMMYSGKLASEMWKKTFI